MTGGAVQAACAAIRDELLRRAAARLDVAGRSSPLAPKRWSAGSGPGWSWSPSWRTAPSTAPSNGGTGPPSRPAETGQGNAHVQYSFAAHRAVVDVDVELGLVKVVEIVTAQDVGKAINPDAVLGQIHGGTAQGLGLALMEEIQVEAGRVRNPSFTDYLIPTILDVPPMHVDVLELADPNAPYGLRGVGEAPTISSTPAIVAAVRAATGRALTRVPVRPEDITGTDGGPEREDHRRPGV